jgi:hypothetical protein
LAVQIQLFSLATKSADPGITSRTESLDIFLPHVGLVPHFATRRQTLVARFGVSCSHLPLSLAFLNGEMFFLFFLGTLAG